MGSCLRVKRCHSSGKRASRGVTPNSADMHASEGGNAKRIAKLTGKEVGVGDPLGLLRLLGTGHGCSAHFPRRRGSGDAHVTRTSAAVGYAPREGAEAGHCLVPRGGLVPDEERAWAESDASVSQQIHGKCRRLYGGGVGETPTRTVGHCQSGGSDLSVCQWRGHLGPSMASSAI